MAARGGVPHHLGELLAQPEVALAAVRTGVTKARRDVALPPRMEAATVLSAPMNSPPVLIRPRPLSPSTLALKPIWSSVMAAAGV
ncbi:hypothetical protein ACFYMW_39790 [Streptomyces sp. NPDC006692]|uniref:hypothetical protein n=1 Tax=Streptomyces sp. NPDC006692 TaxID=3364758 RepID=UPI0036AAABD5